MDFIKVIYIHTLRRPDGVQINHQIYLQFLNVICLSVNYLLTKEKKKILTVIFGYFHNLPVNVLYRTLPLKAITIYSLTNDHDNACMEPSSATRTEGN